MEMCHWQDADLGFLYQPTQVQDLPIVFHDEDLKLLQRAVKTVDLVSKAQYLMFTTVYELELEAIDVLRSKYKIPVYPVGPSVPFFKLQNSPPTNNNGILSNDHPHQIPEYFKWLDCQPSGSVLYISQGSFLSVSSAQMDEIIAGIKESSVAFLWVARGGEEVYDGIQC